MAKKINYILIMLQMTVGILATIVFIRSIQDAEPIKQMIFPLLALIVGFGSGISNIRNMANKKS